MIVTDIYSFFSRHPRIRGGSLAVLFALFLGLLATLHFGEDISDFLPLGTKEREQMSIYQNVSGADKLFVLFSNPGDADYTVQAVEAFLDCAEADDASEWSGHLTGQIDMETISEVSRFVYENIPYFLTEQDLARMDSLLAVPGYIPAALANDRQALLFPSSSLVSTGITHDPLGLFSPVMGRLQSSAYSQAGFELYDNYIFTPDLSRAIVILDSPYGSSETDNNARLIAGIEQTAREMQQDYPDVSVDVIGGPAIAVGNASRIKKDSLLAISLSFILIVLILVYSFNSFRNILLIFLTVGWGLVFALGGLAIFRDDVSIIVIGISSVILGIAINYPLHLISHTAHQPDRKAALREIVSPLVVGNITTVGAFLALVPLKSPALRDLGLFASLLLVGTILFVLVYLPHYVADQKKDGHTHRILDRLAAFSPENRKWILFATAAVTLFLAFFSPRTEFDSNMSHINYMTEAQSRDMQYFEDLLTRDTTHTAQSLYVYGSGRTCDEALADVSRSGRLIDSLARCGLLSKQNDALAFLTPRAEQQRRLDAWNAFVGRHQEELTATLEAEARAAGFVPGAFAGFSSLVGRSASLRPQDSGFFEPLLQTVFPQSVTASEDDGTAYVVCPVNVEPEHLETVKQAFGDSCFEVAGINQAMTGSLSDNFNYIGWACSLIVFFFLWFSFGRIELAIISFLPMAVSWVWILGLMALLGIKFNIVNIILATFIFGQGDDYTVFMTEGCQYEYSRRRPILKSYKSSIIQSAAIMFVGIGTLIVARHPAMRSLAEVTIIGMFSVVFMAYLIPPLLFKALTTRRGVERAYPLTLGTLLFGAPKGLPAMVRSRYAYKGKDIERCVRKHLRESAEEILHRNSSDQQALFVDEDGYGERALLFALSHPDTKVTARIPDEDRRAVARAAADRVADNLTFID